MAGGLLRCCRQRLAFPILPHRHRSSSLPSAGFRARRAATNQGGCHAANLSTGGAPRQNDNYDEPTDPFQLVQPELTQLTGNIGDLIRTAGDHPVLDAVAAYFFQDATRAKHFRPLVVLLIARATAAHSNQPHDVANASQQRLAEISEMIHTASLLHDDVIDESNERRYDMGEVSRDSLARVGFRSMYGTLSWHDCRRGMSSGNAAFGNKVAVLAGDFLLARASMALARLRNTEVVEVVSLVIEELVEGELLQIRVGSGAQGLGLTQQELLQLYLRKNYLKTGSLLANAARASAMLGAHPEPVCLAAYNYGRHLGLAFQLIDDALDFRASSGTLGKPAMADVKLGLATAPVLLSVEHAPEILTLVGRRCQQPGDLEQAMEWVEQAGGVRRTEQLAATYARKAVTAIKQLEPSEPRAALISLTQKVLSRSN